MRPARVGHHVADAHRALPDAHRSAARLRWPARGRRRTRNARQAHEPARRRARPVTRWTMMTGTALNVTAFNARALNGTGLNVTAQSGTGLTWNLVTDLRQLLQFPFMVN